MLLSNTDFPIGWQLQNDCCACLEVKDEAGGIDEEDIDKLFATFSQAYSRAGSLELPVVLWIIKTYNGCVALVSDTGLGSASREFLPVSPDLANHQQTFAS